jgi:hypothetical protein
MSNTPWFLPMRPGEQFIIPEKGEYGYSRCIGKFHIFEQRPGYCKCQQRFWPEVGTKSRIMMPGETL